MEARCEGLGLCTDVVGEREEKGGVGTSSTMVCFEVGKGGTWARAIRRSLDVIFEWRISSRVRFEVRSWKAVNGASVQGVPGSQGLKRWSLNVRNSSSKVGTDRASKTNMKWWLPKWRDKARRRLRTIICVLAGGKGRHPGLVSFNPVRCGH